MVATGEARNHFVRSRLWVRGGGFGLRLAEQLFLRRQLADECPRDFGGLAVVVVDVEA